MTSVVVYSRMWRSGTGLYAQGLARGMALAGHDVTFIAPPGAPNDPAAATPGVQRITPPRELTEREGGSRAVRAVRSLRRIAGGLGSLLRARLACPRIVVTIPEPLIFWLPVLAILRLSGAQVVFVCHDPEPHAWRLPPALRRLERGAIAAGYRWASRIVVLSAATRSALVGRFGIDPNCVTVIPHGAFDEPWAGPLPDARRLLLFGTIRRNKQVLVAMQAVADAADTGARLTVAGGADANDPGYLDECRALAASLGERITMEIGYIADDRVATLLSESDALLLPYADFESQSGVAVLAGMAGRPVICARAGGIPDLIDAGLAAVPIAAPADRHAVAAAIRTFFDTPPDAWTERGVRGRERLAETLAWDRVGAQFAALFA